MRPSEPYFRAAGSGPGVVCIHANASNSAQWRELMTRLAPRYHVLAADSYGAGKGPPWPAGHAVTLGDEAALLEPVLQRAGEPLALVGHSYGGAVALIAAARRPGRVRALVLYEPTLFALVDAQGQSPSDNDGIRQAVERAAAALAAGDTSAAAGHFIDYWMGPGSWRATPAARRVPIEAAIVNIRGWAGALLGETTPVSAFAALGIPVLLMTGRRSPVSSRAVARVLAQALPRLERVEFEDLGHMGPLTHPELVNSTIEQFLERQMPD